MFMKHQKHYYCLYYFDWVFKEMALRGPLSAPIATVLTAVVFWRAENNAFVLFAPKIRMEGGSLTQVLGLRELINLISYITVHKTEQQ